MSALGAALILAGCASQTALVAEGPAEAGATTTPPITAGTPSGAAQAPAALPTVEVAAEPADAAPGEAGTSAGAATEAEPAVAEAEAPAVGPALTDLDGRWCSTAPASWEQPCVTVALPRVKVDGFDGDEYVYIAAGDPTALAAADYAVPADLGGCWEGGIDGYPATSGAALYYCPAGAASGEGWIDGSAFVDQDRLYMTQEQTSYPYVRAD
ncbi:hypothetical protein [Demequina gelatinilytica]|uniref:hypothetical protein n=1 Tax=Demequina gelatinilytica TaxID=1638980 RepID=UPI0007861BC8|nr:hypothetical protein [Demequina gelatinilytica]